MRGGGDSCRMSYRLGYVIGRHILGKIGWGLMSTQMKIFSCSWRKMPRRRSSLEYPLQMDLKDRWEHWDLGDFKKQIFASFVQYILWNQIIAKIIFFVQYLKKTDENQISWQYQSNNCENGVCTQGHAARYMKRFLSPSSQDRTPLPTKQVSGAFLAMMIWWSW